MSDNYQLIIFDWDGTLADSETYIVQCMQRACDDLKLQAPPEANIAHSIGLGIMEVLARLYPGVSPTIKMQIVERYRYHFFANSDLIPLFEGAKETLVSLNERGFMLAVATGKGQRGLETALKEQNLTSLFVSYRTAEKTASKPDPLMLHEILEETGHAPEVAVMVGDTTYDLEMATNAGVDSIAVTYGTHALEHLNQHQPKAVIHDIRELLKIF
jgi:phosphoglycolate phosphatase